MSLATAGARNRSKPPARQFPRWVKVSAAVIVLAAAAALFTVRYLEVYRLNREAARLAAIKRSLQEQNAVLREEIKLLHTPAYVEKIAREQLGLVRPGEIAVLIVRPPAPPPPARPDPAPRHRAGPAGILDALRRMLSP
jgi:cell division protein FtsL